MTLNDPEVVRRDYASEARLLDRRSLYEGSEGPDAREVVWRYIQAAEPRNVLEVGPGPGELSERIARDLGAKVVAIDISPRMVELTKERGIDALLGDVQALPFEDEQFDLVVAAWVLFHPADLTAALAEIARVLRSGGRLVAATNGDRHLEELWELVGGRVESQFTAENGVRLLRRHFESVDRELDAAYEAAGALVTEHPFDHELVEGWVSFSGPDAAREYVASSIVCGHLAEHVPEFTGALRARRQNAIFVAEKAS